MTPEPCKQEEMTVIKDEITQLNILNLLSLNKRNKQLTLSITTG